VLGPDFRESLLRGKGKGPVAGKFPSVTRRLIRFGVYFSHSGPRLFVQAKNHTGARLNELFLRRLRLDAKELKSCEKEFFNGLRPQASAVA
jgi:hypothetical protein